MFRKPTQNRPGFTTLGVGAINKKLVDGPDEEVLEQKTDVKEYKVQAYGSSTKLFSNAYNTKPRGEFNLSSRVNGFDRPASDSSEWRSAVEENKRVQRAVDEAKKAETMSDFLRRVYTPKPVEVSGLQSVMDSASDSIRLAVDSINSSGGLVTPLSYPTGVVPPQNQTAGGIIPSGGAPKYDPELQPPAGGAPKYDPELQPPAGGAPKYDPEQTPATGMPVVTPPASGGIPVIVPPSTGTVPATNPPSAIIPSTNQPITVPLPGTIDSSDPIAAASAIAETEAAATTSGIAAPTLAERAQLDDQIYGYQNIPTSRPYLQVTAAAMVAANRVLYDGLNPNEALKFTKRTGMFGVYDALHTTDSLKTTALYQYVTSNAVTVLNLGPDIPKAASDFLYVETAYVLLQRYTSGKTTANTPEEVLAAMAYAKVQILGYYTNKVGAILHALVWPGLPGDEAFLTKAIDMAKAFPVAGNKQGEALQYMASFVDSSTIAHGLISARDRSRFTSSMINFLLFFADTTSSIETNIRTLSSLLGGVFLTADMRTRGLAAITDFLTSFSGLPSAAVQFAGSAYFENNRLFTWACFLAQTYRNMAGYKIMALFIWRALFGAARRGHLINGGIDEGELDSPDTIANMRQLAIDMQQQAAQIPEIRQVVANVMPDLIAAIPRGLEPEPLIEDAPDLNQQRLSIVAPDTQLFLRRMEFLGKLVFSNAAPKVRDQAREALLEVLTYWKVPEDTVDKIMTEMSSGSQSFQFLKLAPNGQTILSSPTLYYYLTVNAEAINTIMKTEIGDQATIRALLPKFTRPFMAVKSNLLFWQEFASVLAIMFGATTAQVNNIPVDNIGEDLTRPAAAAPATPSTGNGPIIASATGDGRADGKVDGGATMTSVPTPQFTDPPAAFSLENAMSKLADVTNSVQQITRSRAPDRLQWYLIKYRRKSLRALWFAVFTGLGASPEDATQTLNFLDPTFVDVSKDVNEYSGIRTSGKHGVYPQLDAFFQKYLAKFSAYFAERSSDIRTQYAGTFFNRFFGLRGKSYAQRLFSLSAVELAKAAKLSATPLDIVTMDYTFSDGPKDDSVPTANEMSGYMTGPIDYTGSL